MMRRTAVAVLLSLTTAGTAAAIQEPGTLRLPVAHEHASSWCLGYLLVSADRVIYHVRQPAVAISHGFDIARAELKQVRRWMFMGTPANAAEIKFAAVTYRFWLLTKDDVEQGRRYTFDPRDAQDAGLLIFALRNRDASVKGLATTAERTRAQAEATSEPATPVPALSAHAPENTPVVGGALDGLFVGLTTSQRVGIGNVPTTYFENVFYLFFPNGHAYRGVPKGGLDRADFSRLRSADPSRFGAYRITGSTIELRWDDGQTKTDSFVRRSPGEIVVGGVDLTAVRSVAARLDGAYVATSSAPFAKTGAADAVSSTSEHLIRFTTDGRFAQRGAGIFENPTGSGDIPSSGDAGTYRVSGNTLELTSRGTTRLITFFVAPEHVDSPRPGLIFLDGIPFWLEK